MMVMGGRMYNLGQIERVVANGVEDQVLQLVDGRQQVVAEGSHGAGSLVVLLDVESRVSQKLAVGREGGGDDLKSTKTSKKKSRQPRPSASG